MSRWIELLLTLVLGIAMLGGTATSQYPNCAWGCSANDVSLEGAFFDGPATCNAGSTMSGTLFLTYRNGTNTNRYCVRMIAELYVDGRHVRSYEVPIADTIGPGVATIPLTTIAFDCGATVEFRNVVVSWIASPGACGTPTCASRTAKCWAGATIAVTGLPLSADFSSSAPVCMGSPVLFTDETSGGRTPYSYNWNFGDGTAAGSSANPTHLYAAPGTYTVTLSVTDTSGRNNSTTQSVAVRANPIASASNDGPYCPGNTIHLSAGGGVTYSWTGPNGFTNSSQNPTITSATAVNAGAYTVTATNVYGCTGTASTLVAMDTSAPVLSLPANVTIECSSPTGPPAAGQATASDGTDPFPAVSYSDVVNLAGCGSSGTITRTWTATDDCGNSVSGAQTITIVDTTPPTLTISSGQFECDGAGNATDLAAWLASAVGTDTCGAVTVTDGFAGISGLCPGTGSAQVTFTATDACGNATQRTATVTVVDTAPPSAVGDTATTDEDVSVLVDVLANDTDVCDLSPTLVSVGAPTFGTTETVGGQVRYTPPAGFDGTATFSYTVDDCSGNVASALVEVTVTSVNDPPVANDQTTTVQEDAPLAITVTATDPDGDTLTYSILTGPSNGTISGFNPATGQLTYTPAPHYNGPDSFTFEACDPSGACDTGVVTITVEPVDDPPVADPQTLTTPEDAPLPITVTGSDADGDTLTYGIVSGPSNGTISGFDPATGELIYTPNTNFTGTDSFVFETCDPHTWHGCAQATVTITVTAINDPPLANDQSRVTPEDTPTGFFVLAVSDPDNTLAELSCDCQVPPSHGTVVRGADHTVNYTPDQDFSGTDMFTYEVCDPDGLCDTATVTVTVTATNDNPVVTASDQTTLEDTPIEFPVVHSDPDDDPLSCTASDPAHGVASPASGAVSPPYPATDTLTYTPDPGFSGIDQVVITCDDGLGGTDSVTVEITVLPVNDPPVANDQATTAEEDTPLPITVTATDPDGDTLTYSIVGGPSNGTISGFDPATGLLTYTPDADYNGPDAFTFEACDPSDACDTGVVTITVEPVDDPPVADPQTLTTPEDTPLPITVTGSDADVGDPITYGVVSGPSNGTISGFDPATGELIYTPNTSFTGTDSFVFEVCDPHTWHGCAQATVTITVTAINDPPLANDQSRVTPEDTPTGFFSLLISDPDNTLAELSCDCQVPPSHGMVVRGANHTVNYIPDPDFNGTDTFTYVVCDPDGLCDTASVTVNVTPVNDPPVANDDTADVAEDGSVTIDVPDNDSDPDGDLDITSVSIVSPPANGTVTVDPVTGEISYEPDPDFNGTDTFTYQICDSVDVCDTARVTVNVTPVADPPVARNDTANVAEDGSVAINVPGNDSDPDGDLDVTSVSIVSSPANGTVTVDPVTGEISYEPDPDFNGTDTFTYEICDSVDVCDTATVTVNVAPVNDPPIANDDTTSTAEEVAVVVDVTANDFDVDGNLDPTTVTITSAPSNGTVTVDPVTGDVTYTPKLDYNGLDTFSYRVCDTDGLCDTASVTVDVGPTDDPPVATNDTGTVFEDGLTTIDAVANDSDPDGNLDPTSVLVVAPPAHGTYSVNPVSGEITYAPDANYNGPDTLTYQICDTDGECDTATVVITVVPVGDPPVARNDTENVAEDGSVVIGVPDNDSDPDGDLDVTSVSIVSGPSNGTVTVDPVTGEVTYTPDPDFNGTDTFTYQICDSVGVCDTASVTVNVTPVNDPPVANDDTATTDEDTSVAIPVADNDLDVDGAIDPTTVTLFSPPSHGSVSIGPISGAITYVPAADFHGADTFLYQVCNFDGDCDQATVSVHVLPQDDPPIAVCLDSVNVATGVQRIQLRGSDPDGDPLTFEIVEGPSQGTIAGFDSVEGTFYYSSQACVELEASVHVGSDVLPGAVNTRPGAPVVIVVGNGDSALIALLSPPAHGAATVDNIAGAITYTPAEGFEGDDRFTYWVCAPDESGYTGPVSIVFEVRDPSGASDQCVVQLLVVGAAGRGGAAECEQRVLISEVAWSGTRAAAEHEWIELRNLEEEAVDLAGWTLRWRRKQPEGERETLWKAVALSGFLAPYEPDAELTFAPNGAQPGTWWGLRDVATVSDALPMDLPQYFLLERETDTAVLHIDADLVYDETLALDRLAELSDDGEVIQLVDPNGCVVDTANADRPERDGWAAGDLWPPATMERTDPLGPDLDQNWHTNLGLIRTELDAFGNLIHGTPGHENSPILSQAVQPLEPSPHPIGEPVEIRFESRPEWPASEDLWYVLVTRPPFDEVLAAEWTLRVDETGTLSVRVATNTLPITAVHVWIRTPSGDVLVAPLELYPY